MKNIIHFIFTLLLISCASDSYTLREDELTPLEKDKKALEWVSQGKKQLYVFSLEDKRPIQEQVGEVKTGFLRSPTPVYLETPVPYFVKNNLMKTLQERNISIVSQKDRADVFLKGAIKQFWVSEYAPIIGQQQAICHLKLDIALFTNPQARPRWYGVTWVKAVSPESFWDSREYTEKVVASCFELFVQKFLSAEYTRALLD